MALYRFPCRRGGPLGMHQTKESISDADWVEFLQWALPRLHLRWPGFRKVRRQVCRRIRHRLLELNLQDLAAYRDLLARGPAEWSRLDACCRISISRFYRDRDVFDFLRDRVLPQLACRATDAGRSVLRCWSVGCASGEEPYTLSIMWQADLGARFPGLDLEVVATDIDAQLLQRARRAVYGRSSLKDLPDAWVSLAFQPEGEAYRLAEPFRGGVRWVQQDLRQEAPAGEFELVLCRHLALTYFDESLQEQILRRIAAHMPSGGVLVTSKKETLPAGCELFLPGPARLGTYRRR